MAGKSTARIRGGSGLGDSLYVQAIARHLVQRGRKLEVCTNYPEIFSQLDVKTAEFSRQNIDIICHYNQRKTEPTNQFEDCCIRAGVDPDKVEYKLDWEIKKPYPTDKPILLAFMPRNPMDRKDEYAQYLFPDCSVIDAILGAIKPLFHVIQVGKGRPRYKLQNIDTDLSNKTSVTDLLDLAKQSTHMIGQLGNMIPLAESFDKKCLAVWSSQGLNCQDQRISSITPRKVCAKATSMSVVDDWSQERIRGELIRFL